MIFTTGLLFYHLNLIYRNLTTKEELKPYLYKKPVGNPHQRKLGKNCEQSLTPKLSNPSMLEKVRRKNILPSDRMKIVNILLTCFLVH